MIGTVTKIHVMLVLILAFLAGLLCIDFVKSLNHTREKTWQRPLEQSGFGHQPYWIEIEKERESNERETTSKTVKAITIVTATNSYTQVIKITTQYKHSTVCVHEPFPHTEKAGIFWVEMNNQVDFTLNLCSQYLKNPINLVVFVSEVVYGGSH